MRVERWLVAGRLHWSMWLLLWSLSALSSQSFTNPEGVLAESGESAAEFALTRAWELQLRSNLTEKSLLFAMSDTIFGGIEGWVSRRETAAFVQYLLNLSRLLAAPLWCFDSRMCIQIYRAVAGMRRRAAHSRVSTPELLKKWKRAWSISVCAEI